MKMFSLNKHRYQSVTPLFNSIFYTFPFMWLHFVENFNKLNWKSNLFVPSKVGYIRRKSTNSIRRRQNVVRGVVVILLFSLCCIHWILFKLVSRNWDTEIDFLSNQYLIATFNAHLISSLEYDRKSSPKCMEITYEIAFRNLKEVNFDAFHYHSRNVKFYPQQTI